jgi:hypothetical protein
VGTSGFGESWKTLWRYVAGAGAVCVLGWFAFVQGERVPLLGYADFGVHELGHMITMPMPEVVTAIMGNGLQVLAPLALAVWFLVGGRDLLGVALCLAWAGTSAQDASVYIADAPTQQLELVGGEHDWAFVLGDYFDALDSAGTVAAVVKSTGGLLLVTGLAVCLYGALYGLARGQIRPGDGADRRPVSSRSPGLPVARPAFETVYVDDPAAEAAATRNPEPG